MLDTTCKTFQPYSSVPAIHTETHWPLPFYVTFSSLDLGWESQSTESKIYSVQFLIHIKLIRMKFDMMAKQFKLKYWFYCMVSLRYLVEVPAVLLFMSKTVHADIHSNIVWGRYMTVKKCCKNGEYGMILAFALLVVFLPVFCLIVTALSCECCLVIFL